MGQVSRRHPPAWQGEGDADPIGVVLTRTTAIAAPMTVSQTMAPARQAGPGESRESRNWWVQVGEFRSQTQAKAEIEHVARKFAREFDSAEGSVDGQRRTYRARFGGFTEISAKEACTAVRARGGDCAVGGPA